MESKRKQIYLSQKARFEKKLQDRTAALLEKGMDSRKADKDTLTRKWKAELKAVDNRLKSLADQEKLSEELAKAKAEKAAAPKKDEAPAKGKEGGKGEKTKKAPEAGKEKKAKPEKKAKEPEAAKS